MTNYEEDGNRQQAAGNCEEGTEEEREPGDLHR